jgi:hypothetical protein
VKKSNFFLGIALNFYASKHSGIKVTVFWQARLCSFVSRTTTAGKPAASVFRIGRKMAVKIKVVQN